MNVEAPGTDRYDVEAGKTLYASPHEREAVELAVRVALLDTRNSSNFLDSSQIEADDYDGSVSVSEWLRRKSQERAAKRSARTSLAIVVGLALAACIAIIVGIGA
jgi:hypothetical protein